MKRLFVLLYTLIVWVMLFEPVFAGFGITPPYLRNNSLIRNSIYEQTILVVQGDPLVPLKATVSVDVPGVNDWITIVEGNEFILPKGEQKVPMTIRVTVPEDAEFKNYTGNIRIKTTAAEQTAGSGAVNISLGAQIDVDLSVIDKVIKDFRVRKIGINDLNAGHKLGWLYFPGKINFEMMIENTGNVDVAPSSVIFKMYDQTGQILLEDTKNTNRVKKIKPFKTDTVFAELPTRLPPGTYLARYQIMNGDVAAQEGEVIVSIRPYGSVQAAGYGFLGLSLAHKLSILIPLFVILSSIAAILVRFSGRGQKPVRAVRGKR